MKTTVVVAIVIAVLGGSLAAQEKKKVPKDSVRVSVPGCVKGYIFTAARRTEDQPGSADIPEGTHLRMNGPKKLIEEIKAHEGSMIVLTGLMKKGQPGPAGIGIGGGVRVSPGPTGGGSMSNTPTMTPQNFIDVEGWSRGTGECSSR